MSSFDWLLLQLGVPFVCPLYIALESLGWISATSSKMGHQLCHLKIWLTLPVYLNCF